ncbi:MAG TPA: flagellar biosynthesis protein FlgJ [Burkholderiaceae bacterium]|nr:flagellar biosynthesis protein FlgJ [Burkholderiaceae bacterium]
MTQPLPPVLAGVVATANEQDGAAPVAPAGAGAGATAPPIDARTRSAAEQFESLFIHEMLRHMHSAARVLRDADGAGDPVNEGLADHADMLLADSLAGRHAFGVADMLLKALAAQNKP